MGNCIPIKRTLAHFITKMLFHHHSLSSNRAISFFDFCLWYKMLPLFITKRRRLILSLNKHDHSQHQWKCTNRNTHPLQRPPCLSSRVERSYRCIDKYSCSNSKKIPTKVIDIFRYIDIYIYIEVNYRYFIKTLDRIFKVTRHTSIWFISNLD